VPVFLTDSDSTLNGASFGAKHRSVNGRYHDKNVEKPQNRQKTGRVGVI